MSEDHKDGELHKRTEMAIRDRFPGLGAPPLGPRPLSGPKLKAWERENKIRIGDYFFAMGTCADILGIRLLMGTDRFIYTIADKAVARDMEGLAELAREWLNADNMHREVMMSSEFGLSEDGTRPLPPDDEDEGDMGP